MRRLLPLILACACGRGAQAPPPASPTWITANFVGDPPARLMRSREGMLRWTGLWGTRRLQHSSLVSRVAISPDGKWVASACWDGTVKLWESGTGREIRTFRMGGEVFGLAISPDGRRIYGGQLNGVIRTWDVASGEVLGSTWACEVLWGLALSPDGTLLAYWGRSGFGLLDAFTFEFANLDWAQTVSWKEAVRDAAFTPDGSHVLTCGNDNLVRMWTVASGAMTTLQGPDLAASFPAEKEPWFDSVAVDPLGAEARAIWKSGEIFRWDLKSGARLSTPGDQDGGTIRYSPDGKIIVSACGHAVRLLDRTTGRRLREFPHPSVTDVALGPDGSWLASGGEDGVVRVWDAATGEERLAEERLDEVCDLAVSEDGTWAATALFSEARVWDTATGASLRRVTRGDETTSTVAIDPSDHVVSSWTRGVETELGIDLRRTVVVWNRATGETVETRDADTGRDPGEVVTLPGIRVVAVSPDGSRFVGDRKGSTTPCLWTKEGGKVAELRGHSLPVTSAVWSDDGRWIFSGADDLFVRVWEAATGREADLIPVDGRPHVLVFRKGRLYVGCANRTVCVYECNLGPG